MEQLYRDIKITDTNILANGIARIDDQVIFVDGAVEGDTVDIKITKHFKNYSIAEIAALKAPSPYRTDCSCSAFERGCGGCSMRHIRYEQQLKIKLNAVAAAARRVGADLPSPEKILSPTPKLYRNKVVFHYSNGRFGYYRKNSKQVIALPQAGCVAAYPIFSQIAAEAEKYAAGLRGFSPTYLYLRASRDGDSVMMTLGSKNKPEDLAALKAAVQAIRHQFPEIKSVFYGIGDTPEASTVIHLSGDEYLRDNIAGSSFDISPPAFWQVNPYGAELLVDAAAELLRPQKGDRIADLCCGTGLFSIVLASRFRSTDFIGIELNPSAAKNASHNAELNSLSNVKYYRGDCVEIARHSSHKLTAALLDPPRKGAPRELLTEIAKLSIPRIVYVACSPEALARDSKLLTQYGYTVGRMICVDLFASASHVETLLSFELSDAHQGSISDH